MKSHSFQAAQTAEMKTVLGAGQKLAEILRMEGRPISVSLPLAAIESVESFKDVLDELGIESKINVAHKATSSRALVSAIKNHAAIDVASEVELVNALEVGFPASNVSATGPKSTKFLKRLIHHQAIIIVDSLGELNRLIALLGSDSQVTIMLRITRTLLNISSIDKKSRFGFDEENLTQALSLIQEQKSITLRGIAFHLDSQSIEERQYAVRRSLDLLLKIQATFPYATVLDIGGGYGAHYGMTSDDIDQYDSTIRDNLKSHGTTNFWQSRAFGLSSDGARVRGELSGVDVFRAEVGPGRLHAILSSQDTSGTTIAESIRENLVELWIEPGSSIFSHAGIFAAEILDVCTRDGNNFIVVDAHRNQITFEGNEHVADPVLLPQDMSSDDNFETFIAGHLCMESDLMMYRKIALSTTPQVGDIMVWLHTGAYRSHFSASNSIGHPDAARYVLDDGMLQKEAV